MASEDNPRKTGAKRPLWFSIGLALALAAISVGGRKIQRHFHPSEFWALFWLTVVTAPILIIGLIAMARPYYRRLMAFIAARNKS